MQTNNDNRFSGRIIISRTDNIGDVVLTLPLAGFLKSQDPSLEIYFIGKPYTQPIIENSRFVDVFLDREKIIRQPSYLKKIKAQAILFVYPDREIARVARRVGIPQRIGTAHRWFHWWYANRIVHFKRRGSALHEAQLNFSLLRGLRNFGKNYLPTLEEIPAWYGLQEKLAGYQKGQTSSDSRFNLIIHPKSKGSAREWPLINYLALVKALDPHTYNIYITGTREEGRLIRQELPELVEVAYVQDMTGKLDLFELLLLIQQSDALVACSTGPLHVAAALGKYALGLYPPMHPIHPGRWRPLGENAEVLVLAKDCEACRHAGNCACIEAIEVDEVKERIVSHQQNTEK